MTFKKILNHMARKAKLAKMAEKTFRSILTKHYPDIKFHGEDPDCADLWVRALGYSEAMCWQGRWFVYDVMALIAPMCTTAFQ